MPKRRRSGSLGATAGCTANRPPSRYIYLIFDDWLWGYSIRKVDLDQPAAVDDVSGEAAIDHLELEQPPPPSVLRLEAPRGLPMYFASAFGSKIIAMHPREAPAWKPFVHVLDVSTRGFIFGPRPRFDQADPIYIPVGDMLFSLATSSFELLHPPPLCDPDDDRAVWSWRRFPSPPFESKHVTAYTVHPDGQTIFISVGAPTSAATFTFNQGRVHPLPSEPFAGEDSEDDEDDDVEEDVEDDDEVEEPAVDPPGVEDSGWKPYCQWLLPFAGRAHFDRELDAWVGLPSDTSRIGYLCSCDALPVSSDSNHLVEQCQDLKYSKEKLFTMNSNERHLGVTLVYMGGRSNFCLIECVSVEMDCKLEEQDMSGPKHRHLCRLATFSLKYDKNGDLTTGNSHRVWYYRVPKGVSELVLKNPVAFWM